MIFVMVGMYAQGFPRLVQAMDRLAADTAEPITMQTGFTLPLPCYARSFAFAPQDQIERWCHAATAIVAHAGAGSVLIALRAAKPLVLVPRRRALNEHADDHQRELAVAIDAAGQGIMVEDVAQLQSAIWAAHRLAPNQPVAGSQLLAGFESTLDQLLALPARRRTPRAT
jgi:beta-1,4-N-acetylglucosaminyltransferase